MTYKTCECCGKEIIPFRGGLQAAAIRFCNSYCWKASKALKTKKPIEQPLIAVRGR